MGTPPRNPRPRGQKGFSLVFASALSTTSNNSKILDERVQASALVRTQVDDIRTLPYQDSYTVSVATPSGYSLSILTAPVDVSNNLQSNTVRALFCQDGATLLLHGLRGPRGRCLPRPFGHTLSYPGSFARYKEGTP